MRHEYEICYDSYAKDSVKHIWRRGRPTALCNTPLVPISQFKFSKGGGMHDVSEATCRSCLGALAALVATLAHSGQQDRNGELHLAHVTRVASAVEGDDDAVIVAYLHDVIEDSPYTAATLREHFFPSDIVEAVWLLSRDRETDDNTYLARIGSETAGESGRLARKVKLADALDNLQRSRTAGDEKRIAKYERIVDQVSRAMRVHREITPEAFEAVHA